MRKMAYLREYHLCGTLEGFFLCSTSSLFSYCIQKALVKVFYKSFTSDKCLYFYLKIILIETKTNACKTNDSFHFSC